MNKSANVPPICLMRSVRSGMVASMLAALLGASTVLAADAISLPTTLEDAAVLGDLHARGELTREYHEHTFMPRYGKKYAATINSCLARVPNADRRALEFVVALDKAGKVIKIYRNLESNTFACLNEELSKEVFPPPPVAPFLSHFRVEFPE